jgi:phage-related protein
MQIRLCNGCSVNFSQQHNAIHTISSKIKSASSSISNSYLAIFSNFFEVSPSKNPAYTGLSV